LKVLHLKNFCHRDLKPSNILLVKIEGKEYSPSKLPDFRVVLIDFDECIEFLPPIEELEEQKMDSSTTQKRRGSGTNLEV